MDTQEQVNEKSVVMVVKTAKLTGKTLGKALSLLLVEMQKRRNQIPKGKQSVKEIVRQGSGVKSIEITNQNIKSFDRVARKYGVDYALKKDTSSSPPTWLVFFKAKDVDALAAAFNEYNATLTKGKKQSLLANLKKNVELVKEISEKVRKKIQELGL